MVPRVLKAEMYGFLKKSDSVEVPNIVLETQEAFKLVQFLQMFMICAYTNSWHPATVQMCSASDSQAATC